MDMDVDTMEDVNTSKNMDIDADMDMGTDMDKVMDLYENLDSDIGIGTGDGHAERKTEGRLHTVKTVHICYSL
jgi:hypothetical protein